MIAILKSLTVGLVGSGLTYFQYPRGTIELFNTKFPLALGIGLVVFGGSLLAELSHSYIFPHIHTLDKLSEPLTEVVAATTNTLGAGGLLYLSDKSLLNDIGMPMILMASVGSEVVGDYIYTKFLHPMLGY